MGTSLCGQVLIDSLDRPFMSIRSIRLATYSVFMRSLLWSFAGFLNFRTSIQFYGTGRLHAVIVVVIRRISKLWNVDSVLGNGS
jgi:hypothetical protein